jgi:hypothetical protein
VCIYVYLFWPQPYIASSSKIWAHASEQCSRSWEGLIRGRKAYTGANRWQEGVSLVLELIYSPYELWGISKPYIYRAILAYIKNKIEST